MHRERPELYREKPENLYGQNVGGAVENTEIVLIFKSSAKSFLTYCNLAFALSAVKAAGCQSRAASLLAAGMIKSDFRGYHDRYGT